MSTSKHYDVIIIGTGAGGGTLARVLAPTGKNILLLERGLWLPREKDNWDTKTVFLKGKYKSHETWRDHRGKGFEPGIHYWVGGNTKVYGAALLRFRKEDFGELALEGGTSPAWPISYDDMEPYYCRAEKMYHVHGVRGEDPTEPPASEPYPHPPVSHEARVEELFHDLKKAGRTPFHLPMGIMLDEDKPEQSPCIRCETCDGFPCLTHAKADSEVMGVRPALEHENVDLVVGAYVERLGTDASGRSVTEVHVRRDGSSEVYRGDVVVVSCGAINSSALLLRSASDRHPKGLANGSDVVGRHYMCHNNSAMLALSKRHNLTTFQKTLGLNDFYFRDDDFEYPMGHIQMLGKSNATMLRGDAPWFTPGFVLRGMARRAVDFWLTSEDLPDPNNRVEVKNDGIHLHYTPNNVNAHRRLMQRLQSLLGRLGCREKLIDRSVYLGKKIPLAGVAHQCGTVRFGHDPASSALDVHCKAHEVDNLYVVDGSFFPSSTSVNPGLTIIANAIRVGEHLMERMS
ncbi:MAG: GMC oxidoreductase [Myxococcota bacterium]